MIRMSCKGLLMIAKHYPAPMAFILTSIALRVLVMASEYKKQMNAAKQVMGELKIVFATYLVRLMNFPQHRKTIMQSMITLLNQAMQISSALVENKELPTSDGEASTASMMMLIKKLRAAGNEELAKEVEQLLQKEKQSYVLYSPEDEQEVIKETFKKFL